MERRSAQNSRWQPVGKHMVGSENMLQVHCNHSLQTTASSEVESGKSQVPSTSGHVKAVDRLHLGSGEEGKSETLAWLILFYYCQFSRYYSFKLRYFITVVVVVFGHVVLYVLHKTTKLPSWDNKDNLNLKLLQQQQQQKKINFYRSTVETMLKRSLQASRLPSVKTCIMWRPSSQTS